MKVHELGHIVFYVRDIEKSRHFYADVLGWKQITSPGDPVAAFSSGRTHHELLLIPVGDEATPIPRGRRLGMYHFGLKVGTTDDELRDAKQRLLDADVKIVGASDHGVTHSLYIEDPDGNEIELYIDVQPETWHDDPTAIFSPIKALHI